jgi:nucleoside 2-deoxyribosyltransferase
MKKKLVIYLATPYSLQIKSKEIGLNRPDYSEQDKEIRQKRFEAVNEVAGKLIRAGFAVISPISQSHPIAIQGDFTGTFEEWADMDYNLIGRCDMVFVFCQDGWERSEGTQKEAAFAIANKIPVFRIDKNLRILGVQ